MGKNYNGTDPPLSDAPKQPLNKHMLDSFYLSPLDGCIRLHCIEYFNRLGIIQKTFHPVLHTPLDVIGAICNSQWELVIPYYVGAIPIYMNPLT